MVSIRWCAGSWRSTAGRLRKPSPRSKPAADHPDRSFLLGAALLRAGKSAAATTEFEAGAEAKHRPVECEFGAMLARLGAADWSEQCKRLVRALRAIAGGARRLAREDRATGGSPCRRGIVIRDRLSGILANDSTAA